MTDETTGGTAIVAMLEAEHARITAHPGYDSQRTIWLANLIARARGLALTEAASQPREGERWRERWYGSDPEKGSAIVTERGNLVVYLGGDRETHRLTTEIVAAHNAALTQRPPEQAGAVPAGIIHKSGCEHPRSPIKLCDCAAPTPPDAGSGSDGAGDYVAGTIWAEPEDECFTAEVQTVGGHYVVATVHGSTRDEAEQRQSAVLRALATQPGDKGRSFIRDSTNGDG